MYAAHKWPVFPCGDDKQPLTGEKNPETGKGGFHVATTDNEKIRAWWTKYPHAQIGLHCGAAGVFVVDLDEGKDDRGIEKHGIAAFDELRGTRSHGAGLVAKTPRGGRHLFYRQPADGGLIGSRNDLLSAVDVKGDGGYVILPSSASPGREFVEGDLEDIGEAPAWLLEELRARMGSRPAKEPTDTAPPVTAAEGRGPIIDRAECARINAALAVLDAHPRDTWLKVGMALKSTGAGEQAYELWCAWSRTSPKFEPKMQRRTWNSIAEFFDDGSEITIATLFHWAKEAGEEPGEETIGSTVNATPTVISRAFDWEAVASRPPQHPLVGGVMHRGSLVLLAAESNKGKSALMLDLVLRGGNSIPTILERQDWFGRRIEPFSTLWMAYEGEQSLPARIGAWRVAYPAARKHADQFVLFRGRKGHTEGMPNLAGGSGWVTLAKELAHIRKTHGKFPELVVIDTVAAAIAGSKESNEVFALFAARANELQAATGCTVLMLHHLNKDLANIYGGKVTLDRLRGGSSLPAAAETVLAIEPSHHNDPDHLVLRDIKQRDSHRGFVEGFTFQGFQTGRADGWGEAESGGVVVPKPLPTQDEVAEEKRDKKLAEVQRLRVLLLEAVAATADGVRGQVEAAQLADVEERKATTGAAWKDLVRSGDLVESGTSRRSQWFRTRDQHEAIEAAAEAKVPPTKAAPKAPGKGKAKRSEKAPAAASA